MRVKLSIYYAINYQIPTMNTKIPNIILTINKLICTLEIKFIYFIYYPINYQIPKMNTKYQNIYNFKV